MGCFDYAHTRARIGRWSLIAAIVAFIPGVLGGCSWFLPHPERSSNNVIGDADTPRDGRCSMAVAQDRRSLPDRIAAQGIPNALIIHAGDPSASNNGKLRNGQAVLFEASSRDADPPRTYGPGMNRRASPGPAALRSTLWRIEGVDDQDNVLVVDGMLVDGSRFALRDERGSGYLRLDTKGGSISVPRAEASLFILYKADIPNSTRPATCDENLRDEDFVFLHAIEPSAWVSLNHQGVLGIKEAMSDKPGSDSHSNPLCVRQEERCRTDSQGGLICASVPLCASN